jgi:hypothetical protein
MLNSAPRATEKEFATPINLFGLAASTEGARGNISAERSSKAGKLQPCLAEMKLLPDDLIGKLARPT